MHDVNSDKKLRHAMFKCSCGKEFITCISRVKNGNTKSCGCYKIQRLKESSITHGDSKTRLYKIWTTMNRRCYDISLVSSIKYKTNNIKVCDEWKNSYIKFKDWSILNGYSDELSIDRIDSLGNYEPANCRWADNFVQAANTIRLCKRNSSGYRGVVWSKQKNKWQSQINVQNKRIYLRSYANKIDAAKAYDKYVVENNLPHTSNGLVPNYGDKDETEKY